MNVHGLEILVKEGFEVLKKSLSLYWPARGHNDMAERNLTIHVVHSFLQNGWHACAEATFPKSVNKRIDIVLLHQASKTMVVIESKRLWYASDMLKLYDDTLRIDEFRLSKGNSDIVPRNKYGLILSYTWTPSYSEWWCGREHSNPPTNPNGKPTSSKGWAHFGKVLDETEAKCGKFTITNRDGYKKDKCWALYALYKLN